MQKIFLAILLTCSISLAHGQHATLNIRAFIQGFYRGGGTMVAVMDAEKYPDVCDTLTVHIIDTAGPAYRVLYSSTSVISTTGYGSFSFPDAVLNGTYFIQLTHRNALTVFSKYRLFFNNPSVYYDFTVFPSLLCQTSAESDDRFALMYTGDLNQDGNIDSTDLSIVSKAVTSANPYGYIKEDLNGDGSADVFDFSVMKDNMDLPFHQWGGEPNSCLLAGITKIFSYADNIDLVLNATKDSLTINYHVQDDKAVEIFNRLGKLVATNGLEKKDTSKTISVADLPGGIYAVRFVSEGSNLAKRIIK